jgi:glycosyltransferase involved in cell wall biosynthesis
MISLAYISIHPAPYRDPFLNKLAETPGVNLKVFQYESLDRGHSFWNLAPPKYHQFQFVRIFRHIGQGIHFPPLKLVLQRYDYYFIPGTLYLSSLFLLVVLPMLKRKVILCADSVSDATQSPVVKAIKRWIYRKTAFVMVPGEAGAMFFCQDYGFKRADCLLGGYALDVTSIRCQIQTIDEGNNLQFLRTYHLPRDKKFFMMCANMQRNRDYPILVEAFKLFAEDKQDVHLLMIGGGPDAQRVDQMIADFPMITRIDHCSFDELVQFYANIYCYVHTGREPYSTALALGAIAGVPLISSSAVGASYDYIQDDVTGVLVSNYKSSSEWSAAMQNVYDWREEKRLSAQNRLMGMVRKLSPEAVVSAFIKAIQKNS